MRDYLVIQYDNMDATDVLKALQNPTRRKILELVSQTRKGITSSEVSKKLNKSQSIAQRHLEQLERAGILKSKQEQPPVGAPRKRFFLRPEMKKHKVMDVGALRLSLNLIEDHQKGRK